MAVTFDRTIDVRSTPADVWDRLLELDCIAGWVEIIADVEETTHLATYTAVLTDSVGPFRMSADLDIDVTEHAHPVLIKFTADGEDRHVGSRIWVDATLDLKADGSGSELRFHGEYEVTGRVATLGASMIRSKASALLDKFEAGARREVG